MALDNQVYQGIVYTLLFLVYICTHDLYIHILSEGSITGFFFTIGGILNPIAYNTGPGGPINALGNS